MSVNKKEKNLYIYIYTYIYIYKSLTGLIYLLPHTFLISHIHQDQGAMGQKVHTATQPLSSYLYVTMLQIGKELLKISPTRG